MKPLSQPTQDTEALQELGRASAQIVHDLKNQLTGLKLYAIFLRKRHQRGGERQPDELETVEKIAAGLDRTAEDMNVIVRFGRPLELRRAAGVDLAGLLRAAAPRATPDIGAGSFHGEFDTDALVAALRDITAVLHGGEAGDDSRPISLRREEERGGAAAAVVEWGGLEIEGGAAGPFDTFAGSARLRLAQAARVVRAHGGSVEHAAGAVSVRLPIKP